MLLYLAERYQQTDFTLSAAHPEYGSYLNWLFSSDATLTFPQTLGVRYSQVEQPERQGTRPIRDAAQQHSAATIDHLRDLNFAFYQYLVAHLQFTQGFKAGPVLVSKR